jgi:hypothetical protein
LFALLPAAFRGRPPTQYVTVFELLLAYPDVAIWRRLAVTIDRLRDQGGISPAQHAAARGKLDPLLADPATRLE